MKNICIDCRYVNSRPSGIGEMVAALVAHVPQLAPDLCFHLLVSPDASGPLSNEKNVKHIQVDAVANGPTTMWWLPKVVDLNEIDVFHATFNIMPSGLNMPCLTTIHDLMWLNQSHWCDQSWKRAVRKLFFNHGIKRALKHSRMIATVSDATRQAVIETEPDAALRTFVTYSGVSEAFKPVDVSSDALIALGLNPEKKLVLTVGQYTPYKNHETAVRSFARACSNRSDVDLVLVQRQGPQADKLLAIAESLGIAGRVHILRQVKQKDLMQLYCASSLLLHPSLCEGFGHPLAEAMACGCPVITSDRSAMPEVTSDAALLVDPENESDIAAAIAYILDDDEAAQSMKERGFARAAELQWGNFAKANLKLYRAILDQ